MILNIKVFNKKYRQNLHKNIFNIAAHDGKEIEILYRDFPG